MTAMEIDRNLLRRIRGFLDETEGARLYELALEAGRRGACLEIGSYCGKSTVYLGTACRAAGGVLFSVDHHRGSEEQQPGEEYFDPALFDPQAWQPDTFPAFRRTLRLAGLEDTVVPLVCASRVAARMWQTPLSLVFIDGGHALKTVYTDYNAWAGHLMPDGYLLIHDIFENPDQGGQSPYRIYRTACRSGLFEELPRVGTLGILRRRRPDEIPDAFT